MGHPSAPDIEKNAPETRVPGTRDPSYPDRARIDSDVRYLLRPPSSPWIVFDRQEPEGGVGALLSSSRSSVLPGTGVFPEEPAAANPAVEPSNLVVTSDLRDEALAPAPEPPPFAAPPAEDAPIVVPVAKTHRIVMAIACAAAAAGLLAGWSLAHGKKARSAHHTVAAASSTAVATIAAPSNVEVPPPPPTSEPDPSPPPANEAKKEKGFGRLVIKGAAIHNRVYFDKKLLLGHGQRSFMVLCGEHTIGIGSRDDVRDVEVPCNGQLVVSK